MILDDKEKDFIHTSLTLAVFCPARNYSNKLWAGKPTDEELLDMQLFLNQINEHCHERWMFRRLYEDYRVREGNHRAARDDPTTQEQDRKAWKKISARIVGWCQNAMRITGKIKRPAVFR